MFRSREINLECCSRSNLALHGNIAAALFNNPVHSRKPEPGAVTSFFGGKKWLKNSVQCLGFDAGPRVRYHEHNVTARRQFEAPFRIGHRYIKVLGLK